jgi:hypothetical protein
MIFLAIPVLLVSFYYVTFQREQQACENFKRLEQHYIAFVVNARKNIDAPESQTNLKNSEFFAHIQISAPSDVVSAVEFIVNKQLNNSRTASPGFDGKAVDQLVSVVQKYSTACAR